MINAKQIYFPQPKTPRCEAERGNTYCNDTPDTDKQCKHSSMYIIGGKHYCKRHAQIKALDLLLREGN